MAEPASTISSAVVKALSAIKDFPLWLLTAIALSLIAFLFVPQFSAAFPEAIRRWVAVAAVTAAIFAACRFGSTVFSHVDQYRAEKQARRTFHLTPVTSRSSWCATRQKDQTIVTQMRAEFMAKNRTDKILHLLTARVVRPRISGEVLDVFIHTGADTEFGVDCLPPGATMRILVTMLIRGFPGPVRKKLPDLTATIAIADDNGNEQRVKLALKPIGPNLGEFPQPPQTPLPGS